MPGQSVFQRVVGHLVDYALRQVRVTCSTPSGMPCRLGGAAGGPVLPRPGPFPPLGATLPVRLTFACDTGHRARCRCQSLESPAPSPVDPRLCGAVQGLNTTAAGVVVARGVEVVGPLLAAPGPGSIPADVPPVQTGAGVVRFTTAWEREPRGSVLVHSDVRRDHGNRSSIRQPK